MAEHTPGYPGHKLFDQEQPRSLFAPCLTTSAHIATAGWTTFSKEYCVVTYFDQRRRTGDQR